MRTASKSRLRGLKNKVEQLQQQYELGSTAGAVETRLQELMETAENRRTEIARLRDDLTRGHKERDDLEQECSRLEATVEE
jgi:archaellum component FlaC